MEKGLIKDYTSGPVGRQLLAFAWPFMLSNFLQTAYNLVDMAVVGQFVGAAGLSAVSVGTDIMHLYLFIANGFCNAGQVLISQYVGLQDRRSVSKMVGVMFTFILGLSLLVGAAGLGATGFWMNILNVPAEAVGYARAYMICCTIGMPFMFGYLMVAAMLRGMGESKKPMIFIAIASVINVVLDVVLVGLGMGPLGAALATVIAQGISFIVSVIYLWKRRETLGFRFEVHDLLPDRHQLRLLLKLGVPMMIQSCAISLSALFVSSNINTYGVVASAVTGVGAKLSSIANVVAMALSQSGATIVGQNFAARKFDRVKRAVYVAAGITLISAVALSAVMIAAPEQVFSVFSDDPAVLAMSHAYVLIAVLNFFSCGTRAPSMALCNGMGFPLMNFVLGIFDGVVMRIGLCILLGWVFDMGIQGFWLGSALAGYAFFVVMAPYFLSGRWKNRAPATAKGAGA